VVVVIIAIMATLAVPRLASQGRRAFDLTADQVSDVLMMFAQRDQLGKKPVGLRYDAERRWLQMVVLEGDPTDSSVMAEWQPDRFVAPVKLPDMVDGSTFTIRADYEVIDTQDWPLSHTPGDDRPTIEISFESIDQVHYVTLVLGPHAVTAKRSDEARMAVDLDAAGRSREDW